MTNVLEKLKNAIVFLDEREARIIEYREELRLILVKLEKDYGSQETTPIASVPDKAGKTTIMQKIGVRLKPATSVRNCQDNIKKLNSLLKDTALWTQFPPIYKQRTKERVYSMAWRMKQIKAKP